jgi:hypothetical protein
MRLHQQPGTSAESRLPATASAERILRKNRGRVMSILRSLVRRSDDAEPPAARRRSEWKEKIMKFFGYTLGDPDTPVGPENPEMYERMGAFVEEATKAGVLLATGGLAPPNEGVKVRYSGGEFTVLDGPFSEAKEVVGGWALMETRDMDEAVEWVKRFLAIAGEGESTIRQVYGP